MTLFSSAARRLGCIVCLTFAVFPSFSASRLCKELDSETKQDVLRFIRARYRISSTIQLNLVKEETVGSTCYRRLSIEGLGPTGKWNVTLFLSPDERFLSTDLLDRDQTIEELNTQRRERIEKALLRYPSPTLGKENAPLTMVIFSDFQCPFCKQFADVLKTKILPANSDRLRVVFKNLPLSTHPWARGAAEGAACAQIQSDPAFWRMHELLFEHQPSIDSGNIRRMLSEFATQIDNLDAAQFNRCLDDHLSTGIIESDLELASEVDVGGTPTVFLGGERIENTNDTYEIQRLIDQAVRH